MRFALARVAADAINVLSDQRERLRCCEFDGYGALLLLQARGEARRRCGMETTGNRAKVAAFRGREAMRSKPRRAAT